MILRTLSRIALPRHEFRQALLQTPVRSSLLAERKLLPDYAVLHWPSTALALIVAEP